VSKTKIDWCDEVWNPVTGCSKISEGCQNCYAENMAKRLQRMGLPKYKYGFEVQCHNDEVLKNLWVKSKGKIIFINSMSDLFHESVPFDFIDKVFLRIGAQPLNTFIILTKRPERMKEYITSERINHYRIGYNSDKEPINWPLKNLWLGVTVEKRKYFNRVHKLLETPAVVRFISFEPMLEETDFAGEFVKVSGSELSINVLEKIDWVICGGESGANARPIHPDWVRLLRNQCKVLGVPFFFKQWGAWTPIFDRDKDDPCWHNIPKENPGKTRWLNLAGGQGFHGERVLMVKKMKSKRMPELDGQVWAQFPEVKK